MSRQDRRRCGPSIRGNDAARVAWRRRPGPGSDDRRGLVQEASVVGPVFGNRVEGEDEVAAVVGVECLVLDVDQQLVSGVPVPGHPNVLDLDARLPPQDGSAYLER